jgi:hypothetical protein
VYEEYQLRARQLLLDLIAECALPVVAIEFGRMHIEVQFSSATLISAWNRRCRDWLAAANFSCGMIMK